MKIWDSDQTLFSWMVMNLLHHMNNYKVCRLPYNSERRSWSRLKWRHLFTDIVCCYVINATKHGGLLHTQHLLIHCKPGTKISIIRRSDGFLAAPSQSSASFSLQLPIRRLLLSSYSKSDDDDEVLFMYSKSDIMSSTSLIFAGG